MPTHASSTIFIPAPSLHPGEPTAIHGILEQLEPEKSTQGKKLALVLHGVGGHKDHLFLKQLASTLPMDAFRFDFRGSFESPGIWRQNKMEEDVLDLRIITDYLKAHFGYQIDLVIGHSRGAVLAIRWLCTSEDGKKVSGFVIVSATYRMKTTDVLIIHGLKDKGVPVYNAVLYAKALSKRSTGTYSLHFMEDTDHTYTGQHAEVVQTIVDWWDSHSKGRLQTGIWMGPERNMKGKL
ncbi:alpha/beta-hydrolase [Armillaria gallica]|uniref:Alpha/beta-hydrolase n=1 Tax=Armillaria gallica TaxID=47427 RepID=A0A2H3D6Y5_ARMGA|nr:alpha/beta-hydrolase [Armillaria gallica]